ncbi:hypothetical protein D3C87_1270620 [compost metagenome]
MVADARQHRHHHFQDLLGLVGLALIDAVFGFQMQVHHIRQDPDHRFAGARFKPVETGLQQGNVAAKTVDDEAFDPRLLARRQQLQCAHQMRENPAAVDVGDQQHRAIHRFGEPHVGDVAGTQIDFRRRTRTFDHHHRIRRAQPLVRDQHRFHRDGFVVVIGHGIHRRDRTAMDDHLSARIAVGLEQHRVHVGMRLEERRLSLHGLRATDFASVGRHRTVERHVLRLERHHADTLTRDPAAQRRHQGTFTGIGGGALHHQRGHGCSLVNALNAASRRTQSASSPGKPKRRLLLCMNRRSRMPRRAMNSWSSSARSVISH